MNLRIRLFLLSALCSASIVFAQSETYSAESVDLGLSVKWATCNLGAKQSHEVGNYYAWGETEPKETYAWETYLHCNGTDESLTKYCWNSSLGTVDDLRQLEAEDDAAAVKLGAGARIPTADEWQELIDNTYQEKTTVSGVAGWRFTSKKNGQSIFIPNGGYKSTSGYDDYYKDQVYCWASTNYMCYGSNAQNLWAAYNSATIGSIARCVGMNIRPVFGDVVSDSFSEDSILVSTTLLDFGEVAIGRTKMLSFEIKNVSTSDLDITIDLREDSEFSCDWNGSMIGAGDSVQVQVCWNPQKTRLYVGDILKIGTEKALLQYQGYTVNLTGSCVKSGASLEGRTHLMVWQKDGSKVSFILDEHPNVTMSQGFIYISSSSLVAEYKQTDILKHTYENLGIGKIHEIAQDTECPYQYMNEALIFNPCDVDMHVRIVTVNGIIKEDIFIVAGTSASVSLDSYSTGIYLISVNNTTYKLIRP